MPLAPRAMPHEPRTHPPWSAVTRRLLGDYSAVSPVVRTMAAPSYWGGSAQIPQQRSGGGAGLPCYIHVKGNASLLPHTYIHMARLSRGITGPFKVGSKWGEQGCRDWRHAQGTLLGVAVVVVGGVGWRGKTGAAMLCTFRASATRLPKMATRLPRPSLQERGRWSRWWRPH